MVTACGVHDLFATFESLLEARQLPLQRAKATSGTWPHSLPSLLSFLLWPGQDFPTPKTTVFSSFTYKDTALRPSPSQNPQKDPGGPNASKHIEFSSCEPYLSRELGTPRKRINNTQVLTESKCVSVVGSHLGQSCVCVYIYVALATLRLRLPS